MRALGEDGKPWFNKARLAKVKKDAFWIEVGRVVAADHEALHAALVVRACARNFARRR